MSLGRISGPLLFSNLKRNGVDLKITNSLGASPVLKLDVTNNRIGIGTDSPISELQVPTSFNTSGLIATGTVNVANFSLANQEINVSSGDIIVDAGSLIQASAVATDDIKIEENNIYGTATEANIELKSKETPNWTQQQKLTASDAEGNDRFGRVVGISGDTAIVGTETIDAAYIFTRSGSSWSELQILTASDFESGDHFGISVAIDGDYAVVGADRNDDGGSSAGSAYIFKRSGNTWTEQQKLTASDASSNNNFGSSVAIQGDTVIIGSDSEFQQRGAAYIFTRSGSTWTEQQKIVASDRTMNHRFGTSVAIDGNTVVVGSASILSNITGGAYVFTLSGSTWTEQQKLVASDSSVNIRFGWAVGIAGDTVIVGAYLDDQIVNNSGSVYVFTRSSGTFTQTQKIINPTPGSSDQFGYSVAIYSNTFIVGAKRDAAKGSAFVFILENSAWTQLQNITASDGSSSDFFGESVAISSNELIVGAFRDDSTLTDTGSAYVFSQSFTEKTEIQSDLDVTANLHATGNITFGGTITLGSGVEDDIVFAADVKSDIIPDVDNTYIFGRDTGQDSTTQRLGSTFVDSVTVSSATSDAVIIDGVDYALAVGNSFFVAVDGDDTNRGDHPQGAFKTLKHALSAVDSSVAGPTTIHIMAGSYTEEFPLTVPESTNVLGVGFREVEIKPTVATQDKDCFLLTGQTTVANVTVMDFYYNSSNDTGYAFRFAANAITSTRSPYIQNVTVITKGSVTSSSDPRGFDQGDAGRGALVDGSALNSSSVQASMLFHSCTFIVPGAIGLRMKDGVRIEWLNSFTYFADIGMQAVNGSTGFISPHDGSTRNFGAELRAIGSANVYGNKGAVADGNNCVMYLIQHNMAYIGLGKSKENDKTLRNEANEITEANNGKIYFQTTDATGKFKVGNSFFADFETGTTSIDANSVDFDTLSKITVTTGQNKTFIDGEAIDTGNLLLSGSKFSSSTGNLVFDPITKIEMRGSAAISGKLALTGNLTVGQTITKIGDEASDIVRFNMDFDQDIEPDIGGLYSLGTSSKRWNTIYTSEANIDDVRFFDNQITTSVSNSDLELVANGTGRIYLENNNIQADNNFQVDGTITLPSVDIDGTITHTGNSAFNSSYAITGALTTTNIDVVRDVALEKFDIRGNVIEGTVTNGDINLEAGASGRITSPYNKVIMEKNLTARNVTVIQPTGNIVLYGTISDPSFNYPKTYTLTANGITYTYNATGEDERNYFAGIAALNVPGLSVGWHNEPGFTNGILITYTPQTANDILVLSNIPNDDTNGWLWLGHVPGTYTAPSTTGITFTEIIDANKIDTGKINVNDNFITTLESNDDLALSAAGTGNVLIEDLIFIDSDISNSTGDISFTPDANVNITSTTALQLPKGNEGQRRNTLGDVRFNDNKNLFEAYSTGVLTLGGVYSDDQQTFINVNPLNNYIDFRIAGSLVATVNSTQFEMPGLQADDILINGNIITTTVSNSDLDLVPNGSGKIVLKTFTDTELTTRFIKNKTTGALTFDSTGDGYVKAGGTYGVRIPTGTDAQRGSGNQIGDTRYNTQQEYLETWDGSLWQISAGGGGEVVSAAEMEDLILEFSLALG